VKVGDRVKMSPMWKYDSAAGVIVKINKEYTVVRWDDVNGEWHYTKEQAKKLEVINAGR
jgi:hypothetical protein